MQHISAKTCLAVMVTGSILALLCSSAGHAAPSHCTDSKCSDCQFCSLAVPACAMGDTCPAVTQTPEEVVLPDEELTCPIAIELSGGSDDEANALPQASPTP